jgi:hypothetical protein
MTASIFLQSRNSTKLGQSRPEPINTYTSSSLKHWELPHFAGARCRLATATQIPRLWLSSAIPCGGNGWARGPGRDGLANLRDLRLVTGASCAAASIFTQAFLDTVAPVIGTSSTRFSNQALAVPGSYATVLFLMGLVDRLAQLTDQERPGREYPLSGRFSRNTMSGDLIISCFFAAFTQKYIQDCQC